MVDLRWGVGTPAAERHDTVELHVENLQLCQGSQGPNFIVRYDHVLLFDSTRVQIFDKWHLCVSDDEFIYDSLFCWLVVCRTEVRGPEPSLYHHQRGL